MSKRTWLRIFGGMIIGIIVVIGLFNLLYGDGFLGFLMLGVAVLLIGKASRGSNIDSGLGFVRKQRNQNGQHEMVDMFDK